jgi:hypothetical protein
VRARDAPFSGVSWVDAGIRRGVPAVAAFPRDVYLVRALGRVRKYAQMWYT